MHFIVNNRPLEWIKTMLAVDMFTIHKRIKNKN